MNPSIKFIYFDVGGVLLHFRGAFHALANETNIPHAEFERVLRMYDNQICANAMSINDLWQHFEQKLNIPHRENFNYLEYLTSHYTPIKESHQLIKDLIHHYPVGLLTNTYDGMLKMGMEKGFIPHLPYSAVIESCKVRVIKPDRQIFKHAENAAKVPAENILLIDDMVKNTNAAAENNWQYHLFSESNPEKSIALLRQLLL